jgi:hypothetical protein
VREEEELKLTLSSLTPGRSVDDNPLSIFARRLWQRQSLGELPRFEKRNMVNTYVWTADVACLLNLNKQWMCARKSQAILLLYCTAGVFADLKAVIMDVAVALN